MVLGKANNIPSRVLCDVWKELREGDFDDAGMNGGSREAEEHFHLGHRRRRAERLGEEAELPQFDAGDLKIIIELPGH